VHQRLARAVGHRADVEIERVEDDAGRAGGALDVERRAARQLTGGKVRAQIQRDVRDARFRGHGERMDVAFCRRCARG
jgi:hypothetical protein